MNVANWLSHVGLIGFIVVVIFNVIGLLLDFVLLVTEYKTISEYAKIYPVIGCVIVGWQFLGAFAILYHFARECK